MLAMLRGSSIVAIMLGVSSAASAQTLTTAEAAKHIGENKTVCGDIASEHTANASRGTPTFINLDRPYPNQVFTILIWGGDKTRVGDIPKSGRVCATGPISKYRGVPEIIVHDSHSWYVPK